MTPQKKAALTRKRRARERARAARQRSAKAKKAALARWYPSGKKRRKERITQRERELQKKSERLEKKLRAAKERAKEVERENRRIRRNAKKREEYRKKRDAEKRKKSERKEALFKRGMKKARELATASREYSERFGVRQKLPRRLKHETDRRYANRIIKQMFGENMYGYEEAVEFYQFISEISGAPGNTVFHLFMSPQVA